MTRALEAMKQQTMIRFTLAGLTLLLIAGLYQVQAGCSRYGHSCFGAHGKRTDPSSSSNVDYNNAIVPLGDVGYVGQQQQQQQQPNRYYGVNRLPPYLLEWALAAQRATDLRQAHEPSKDDSTILDSTK